MIFSALFLSSCGKHDETEFKINYECTIDEVCSIAITPVDAFYEEVLVTDQLLYTNKYAPNEFSSHITWEPQSSANPEFVSDDVLKEDLLRECSDGKCSPNSDPTGIKFNTENKSAEVYVSGYATVKNKQYRIDQTAIINFTTDITAPRIAINGICDSSNLNCKFEVTSKPDHGASPYEYRWYLNDTQIAKTSSDDTNKGELSYQFEALGDNDNIYMIAVDKNGNHSPSSNKITLSKTDIVITAPAQVTELQSATFTAAASGGRGIDVSKYDWTGVEAYLESAGWTDVVVSNEQLTATAPAYVEGGSNTYEIAPGLLKAVDKGGDNATNSKAVSG
ncbi:hypothetical protein, partial [Francisella hispaniensis]|uniref:hypothetical protein n=1 Tax=Francisella hispaniensis TaxID=622488 RepID=UPI0019036150